LRDVLVLGAGVAGICTALELQSRGYAVSLVDRSAPGTETSYGNSGIIMADTAEPFALPRDPVTLIKYGLGLSNDVSWNWRGLTQTAPALWRYFYHSASSRHRTISKLNAQLTARATQDHAPLIQASGTDNLISHDGFCEIFRHPRDFEKAASDLERIKSEYGVPSRVFSGADYIEPAFIAQPAGAIQWMHSWTCINPGKLMQAYADLFSRQGGEIVTGDASTLQKSGHRWKIQIHNGIISAEHVVIALGPWSQQILKSFGYSILMVLKRGYHAHFNPPVHPQRPYLDADFGIFVSPMQQGLRLSSGAALVALNAKPDTRQLDQGIVGVRELIDLGERVKEPQWYGTRPCMPDMLPMVGPAPKHTNMWFNFGHGHLGFTLGPTTAQLLADSMDGKMNPLLAGLAPANRLS